VLWIQQQANFRSAAFKKPSRPLTRHQRALSVFTARSQARIEATIAGVSTTVQDANETTRRLDEKTSTVVSTTNVILAHATSILTAVQSLQQGTT
jgi:hypothetical protein